MNKSKWIKVIPACVLISILIMAGFSTAVSAAAGAQVDTKAISDYINSTMKTDHIPGLALAVVKGDQIVYLQGYGKADNNDRKVTPQTPFILGSVSKSFTGLAISQLIEDGKIDIDAPVQRYLPWFTLADPEAAKQITISDLLAHISGLSTKSGDNIIFNDNISIEQMVRNLKNTQISQPVGTKYQYCNLNYVILGEVIQAVTGIPYGQYIEENIFQPLEMTNSFTSQAAAKKDGLATGYQGFFGFVLPRNQTPHTGSTPAGFLISSSEDMGHYLMAEMNGGLYDGNQVISKHGMEQTQTPILYGTYGISGSYGMGWGIGNGVIGHDGATENFCSSVYMTTELGDGNNWGVVVLINSRDLPTEELTGQTAYGNITADIVQILKGYSPVKYKSGSKFTYSEVYHIYWLIIALLIMSLLITVFGMYKHKEKLNKNKINIKSGLISLAIIHLLVPLSIVLCLQALLPGILGLSLKSIILLIPDAGVLLLWLPALLLVTGVIKLIWLLPSIRNKKSISLSPDANKSAL